MKFKVVRGTKDILPEEIGLWQEIENAAHRIFELYGYKEIRTPVFEATSLFERGIGEGTEVVAKQMYTFLDKKKRSITLRPEATASVVRAYLEHSLRQDGGLVQLYYIGPMFRYERPQAGRQRQFWQLGTELFGSSHPARDAELIGMIIQLFKELGLKGLRTEINSVGCSLCRPKFICALKDHFQEQNTLLCPDCQDRLEKNPLRILDCKKDICRSLILKGPGIDDYLCKDCLTHLDQVRGYLDLLNISYVTNPHLVRGLDYYIRTVFEIIDERLGAQDALAAGGRYDELVSDFGGPPTPALGFAAGIERIVLSLEKVKGKGTEKEDLDVYIASIDDAADGVSLKMAENLRKAGAKVILSCESRSAKNQARLANKSKGRFLVVIGENELSEGMVRPKDMVAHKLLDPIPLTEIIDWFEEVLSC